MLIPDPVRDARAYLADGEHARRCAQVRHWTEHLLIAKGAAGVRDAVVQGLAPVRGVLLDGDALTVRTIRFGAPLTITTICDDLDEAADEARTVPAGDKRAGAVPVRTTLPRTKIRDAAGKPGAGELTSVQAHMRGVADDAERGRAMVRGRFGGA